MSGEILGNRVSAGHPCPHGSEKGCDVYSERPEVPCRTFICSWLVEDSPLPAWMRPDKCGAIVLLSVAWHGEKVISAIPVGKAVPAETLEWLKTYAVNHSRPILIYERITDEAGNYTGLRRFGFGPPAFREKVSRLMKTEEAASIPMKSV